MNLYVLILVAFVLVLILSPEVYLGLVLTLLTKYRNYQGRKKLKIIQEFLDELVEKEGIPKKVVDKFLLKYSDEIIATEGNIELSEVLKKAHPLVKSSFSEDRLWVYGLRRMLSKYIKEENRTK
ncbi:hypothetical protein A2803_04795 [Candidatus Woesebacteria bacterium RIFCSPHIGHO2_01_FULL_44_21]|uniref:Uncharacterized protein n=1 Tax=Candidatus Woesebacteria bacterium RIFCSPHIGHO2_01_FULL_44_21 TaxID=1802503 RepID=A0A1F7Z3X8_9BACT|nr:MAG: hypothetical protein A2803_04795 [Candidatus Woesebacteria bacterium RIFCSPHIGHO2_01_FULL_44_21]OGM69436.1 MAG: hypothetical protein A2897_03725 [Candidatus Woesebacteria bacterium RIFCSPLOWO2_01_FULL_44_24b]